MVESTPMDRTIDGYQTFSQLATYFAVKAAHFTFPPFPLARKHFPSAQPRRGK